MDKYVIVDGKKYKRGYTTGSCAAAATSAALRGLLFKEVPDIVRLTLPKKEVIDIEVFDFEMGENWCSSTVIKDGGDDIDATNNMEIVSRVMIFDNGDFTSNSDISIGLAKNGSYKYELKNVRVLITSGVGIGVASRSGLGCEVGKPAINPVPREMIINEVKRLIEKYDDSQAVDSIGSLEINKDSLEINKEDEFESNKKTRLKINKEDDFEGDKEARLKINKENNLKSEKLANKTIVVEISAPKGEEIAKKTFNEKLGIIGGISIIGTTGIVEPMSEEGWKKTLSIELEMQKNKGMSTAYLAPGNHGTAFLIDRFHINGEDIVKISNFVGYMLMEAKRLGFKKIFLVGHIGKLVKVAGGIFHTHSRVSDARNEILIANLALMGAPTELLKKVEKTRTTDESVDMILNEGYGEVYNILARKCVKRSKEHMRDENIDMYVALFSLDGRLLGVSDNEMI